MTDRYEAARKALDHYSATPTHDPKEWAIRAVPMADALRDLIAPDAEPEAYLPPDIYNRVQMHLLGSGKREALLLAGEIQSVTGASILRRRNARATEITQAAPATIGSIVEQNSPTWRKS